MEKELHDSEVVIPTEDDLKEGSMLDRVSSRDNEPPPVWSTKEERLVRLKLDLFLMPLLVFGFFVLQLDRSNISNAMTDTITEDLNITKDQVGTGSQLMSAGIVVAEIPSNLILQRLGAPVWLTFIIAVWGTISLAQAYVTNISSFYATRFLLGIFEGGYIPGAQYVLALFYKSDELALRTAIFYFGNFFSAATGSLIAAGLLQLAGRNGLSGWQWLFIIEGAITLTAFFLLLFFLPFSPQRTKPLHGLFDIFTQRERDIMYHRVVAEDNTKAHARAHINRANFFEALTDYRLWLHAVVNMLAASPKTALGLYGPSIIKRLGFSKTKANLLNSVHSYCLIVLSFILSFASDKTGQRGIFCNFSYLWSIVFAAALVGLGVNRDKWLLYAIFTLVSTGNSLGVALNDAWLSVNATSPSKRSMGLAFAVIGSNLGGVIGPSLFRDSDAPAYRKGFAAIIGMYGGAIATTLGLMFTYWRDGKRARKQAAQHGEGPEEARRFQL